MGKVFLGKAESCKPAVNSEIWHTNETWQLKHEIEKMGKAVGMVNTPVPDAPGKGWENNLNVYVSQGWANVA